MEKEKIQIKDITEITKVFDGKVEKYKISLKGKKAIIKNADDPSLLELVRNLRAKTASEKYKMLNEIERRKREKKAKASNLSRDLSSVFLTLSALFLFISRITKKFYVSHLLFDWVKEGSFIKFFGIEIASVAATGAAAVFTAFTISTLYKYINISSNNRLNVKKLNAKEKLFSELENYLSAPSKSNSFADKGEVSLGDKIRLSRTKEPQTKLEVEYLNSRKRERIERLSRKKGQLKEKYLRNNPCEIRFGIKDKKSVDEIYRTRLRLMNKAIIKASFVTTDKLGNQEIFPFDKAIELSDLKHKYIKYENLEKAKIRLEILKSRLEKARIVILNNQILKAQKIPDYESYEKSHKIK